MGGSHRGRSTPLSGHERKVCQLQGETCQLAYLRSLLEDRDEEAQGPRRPWYRNMDINAEPPLPERSTGTTLATGPISRCCPLVPEILNSLPSSMAELFVKTQDTSSPNVFLYKRDVNSISRSTLFTRLSI